MKAIWNAETRAVFHLLRPATSAPPGRRLLDRFMAFVLGGSTPPSVHSRADVERPRKPSARRGGVCRPRPARGRRLGRPGAARMPRGTPTSAASSMPPSSPPTERKSRLPFRFTARCKSHAFFTRPHRPHYPQRNPSKRTPADSEALATAGRGKDICVRYSIVFRGPP